MSNEAGGHRNQRALAGYQRIRNESLVNNNSPQQLILLVYEALIDKLVKLEYTMASADGSTGEDKDKDFADQLLRVMQLIQYGLRDSLSFDSGGEVALNLDKTYVSWIMTLEFLATSRRPDRLAKLIDTVRDMRDTWKTAFASLASAG
jgi:flagellar biosynthetic protein FliS